MPGTVQQLSQLSTSLFFNKISAVDGFLLHVSIGFPGFNRLDLNPDLAVSNINIINRIYGY
jgi:hypothetical protein